jgi:hypothetical protein
VSFEQPLDRSRGRDAGGDGPSELPAGAEPSELPPGAGVGGDCGCAPDAPPDDGAPGGAVAVGAQLQSSQKQKARVILTRATVANRSPSRNGNQGRVLGDRRRRPAVVEAGLC